METIRDRNITSHSYEEVAMEIIDKIRLTYIVMFDAFEQKMKGVILRDHINRRGILMYRSK